MSTFTIKTVGRSGLIETITEHVLRDLVIDNVTVSYTPNVNSSFNQGLRAVGVNTYKNPIYINLSARFLLSAETEVRKSFKRAYAKQGNNYTTLLMIGEFSVNFSLISYNFSRSGSALHREVSFNVFIYPPLGTKFSDIVRGIASNVIRSEQST